MTSKFVSIFIQEQQRYSFDEISLLFKCDENKTIYYIKKLKEYGILKLVRATEEQKDLSDLNEKDIEIADVINNSDYYYVPTFVGIINIDNLVLKFYPKYIKTRLISNEDFKLILKVLEKYNKSKEQIIKIINDTTGNSSFNLLATLLFLLQDYFENGPYNNTKNIIETNGTGEILWEKTVNDCFAILSKNKPYYLEFKTHKTLNDNENYIKRLYDCILTRASNILKQATILNLFDIPEIELSEENIDDFGDIDYILYKIENELQTEFNTRKQLVLKVIYSYIINKTCIDSMDCLSMYGTSSFNLVWEEICSKVLDNDLNKKLKNLNLVLNQKYKDVQEEELIKRIKKPVWFAYEKNEKFLAQKTDTLKPDIIHIVNNLFIIFDAKYYNITISPNVLKGQPPLESVTKQYLYNLAYKEFINDHNLKAQNYFLMPTEKQYFYKLGMVNFDIFDSLELSEIEILQLPDKQIYNNYLNNKIIDFTNIVFEYL